MQDILVGFFVGLGYFIFMILFAGGLIFLWVASAGSGGGKALALVLRMGRIPCHGHNTSATVWTD